MSLLLPPVSLVAQVGVPVIEYGWDIPGSEWVSGDYVVGLGDIDGDDVPEVAASENRTNHSFSILSIHSRTDIVLRELGVQYLGTIPSTVMVSAAAVSDMDGDGVAELAVGVVGDGVESTGALWIRSLTKPAEFLPRSRMLLPPDVGIGGQFGRSMFKVPSVDGDRLDDLIVGAPGVNAVYMVYPNADMEAKKYQKLRFDGLTFETPKPQFGYAVSRIGDLDKNGVDDIAVGAPDESGKGAVYIGLLELSDSLIVKSWQRISASLSLPGLDLDEGDRFGFSVSEAPDLDNDGTADLLVGAPYDDDGGLDRGAVWIVSLRSDGSARDVAKLSDTRDGVPGLLRNFYRFGSSVSWLGDVDADGAPDLVVGVPGVRSIWFLYRLPVFPVSSRHNIREAPAQPTVGQSVELSGYWGNTVADVILQFREAGQVQVFEQSMTVTATTGEVSGYIPSRFVGSSGTEYALVLTTSHGATIRSPNTGFFSIPVRVPDGLTTRISGGRDQSDYQLFTIPLVLDNIDARSILEASFGPMDPTEWRLFGQDGASGSVIELGVADFDIRPGRAFWVTSRREIILDSGPGVTVPSDRNFRMGVRPGWNLVGSPYNFAVPVGAMRLDRGGAVDVREFDSGWRPADTLDAMTGYALWSPEADTLDFDLASGSERSNPAIGHTQPNWSIRIDAEGASGQDFGNRVLVVEGATSGRDPFDRPEPPHIGDRLQLWIDGTEWNGLADGSEVDARPMGATSYEWVVALRTKANEPASLTFSGIESVPESFDVYLLDRMGGKEIDLREAPMVPIGPESAEQTRHYRLVVTDRAISRPAGADAISAYPNPFTDNIAFKYSIREESRVSISVFNVLGQLVRKLVVDKRRPPGTHEIRWDGLTETGARASPGLYLVELDDGFGPRFCTVHRLR